MTALIVLFIASLWAGAQNALAGGGSFITLPSLMLTGMDARAANITSTVALFPGPARHRVHRPRRRESPPGLTMRTLVLDQPARRRARRAHPARDAADASSPASCRGSSCSRPRSSPGAASFAARVDEVEGRLPPWGMALIQFLIAVYGGYFGGGIGFLMMASLTMAGLAVRNAGALKNILAGVMNASAVAIFVFSNDVYWPQALVTAVGASFGGWAGALMLKRVNEKLLKLGVVAIGVALTIGLFWRAA